MTKDLSFLEDASILLEERAGFTDEELDTPEKVYDAYMEHFRISDVNEVTTSIIAQAEHDVNSQRILITKSKNLITNIIKNIFRNLKIFIELGN